jgi:hypothetical protein
MGSTASNIWQSSGDATLQATDVYKQTNSAVITSVKDFSTSYDFGLTNVLRGAKSLVSGLKAAETALADAKKLKSTLSNLTGTNRLLAISGITSSLLSKAGLTDASSLFSSITTDGKLAISLGKAVQQAKATNFDSLSSVSKLLSAYSGNAGVLAINDAVAKVALSTSLSSSLSSLGVTGSFSSSISALGTDTSSISQVAQASLPTTISGSDVANLAQMGDALGTGGVLAINPTIISDFSSSYTASDNSTDNTISSEFTSLTAAYSSVDSAWMSSTLTSSSGTSETAVDFSKFADGSDDFKTLVVSGAQASSDTTLMDLAYSDKFETTSVEDQLATDFPMTVASSGSQTTSSSNSSVYSTADW